MKCLIKEKLSEHKYRDNNGYLICVDSVLARTGKQRYLRSEIFADAADDDSEIEVDRKPEEVFSEKTLASFENCPLCVEHPDEDVNPDNYKDYAVGFVRDVHKGNVDGQDVILGTLVITDGKTIEEVENGQHTDLSCGYDCDIEDSANPQQRNIRGNHVALCEQGRAGNARIVDTAEKIKDDKYKVGQKWKGANGAIITLVRYDGIKPVVRNNLDPFSEQRFANDFDLEEDLLKFNNYKMIDSVKDDTYTIQQHNGKWYYEIKEDDGFTHLVGPYTSMEEAIMYFKKHRPNETLTDEESTAEKVTKNLEKNFENFKETKMKDDSDLSLLREYFKEKQPSRKMELRNKLRSMGYKEGISGVNSSSRLWVELNGKKYEVKNLSSVTPLDSIKDSIREGETYTNKNGVQLKILGINTDVTGKKYATYRIKNDTYNHPVENVENMLKANHYTKDSAIRDSYVVLRKDEAFEESGAKSVARKYNLQVKMDGYKNIFSGKEEDIIRMLYDYFKPQYAGQIELRIKDSSIKDSYIYADLGQDYHKNADDIRKKGLKVSYMGRSNGFGMYGKIEGTRKQLERLQELGYFENEIIHDAGIKDSVFTFNYKDLYHNESHKEDIKANTVEEAIEELKKRVALRGIGTANVWVVSISSETETYPRGYGKLNSLTLDSGKLKDSCKKDSLVNIIKVAKVVKRYGK